MNTSTHLQSTRRNVSPGTRRAGRRRCTRRTAPRRGGTCSAPRGASSFANSTRRTPSAWYTRLGTVPTRTCLQGGNTEVKAWVNKESLIYSMKAAYLILHFWSCRRTPREAAGVCCLGAPRAQPIPPDTLKALGALRLALFSCKSRRGNCSEQTSLKWQSERKNICSTLFLLENQNRHRGFFFRNPRWLFRQSKAYFPNITPFWAATNSRCFPHRFSCSD